MASDSIHLTPPFYLYETPSRFYIQPADQNEQALIIEKEDESSLVKFANFSPPTNSTSTPIYGLIGITSYLIVIREASEIGLINNQPIYRLDRAQVIPIGYGSSNSEAVTIESFLQTPSFYFSYTYDLTNSLQRIYQKSGRDLQYDKRFLWNRGSLPNRYCLPFIHGFISINEDVIGGLKYVLISRRGVDRAGTRFLKRGADESGNVANFVETEQIVEDYGTLKTSFVQVRGSIPLIWRQSPTYRYKPEIIVDHYADQDTVMKKHFEKLTGHYNNVSVINLIDSVGHEGYLANQFRVHMDNLQSHTKIPYHYFDFHKECSKMRWYRLRILIDTIQREIDSYGYFAVAANQVIQQQRGVFRTNCIDSLDRTNVVQNMIAQVILGSQLKRFNRAEQAYDIIAFKNIWADNADALSIQYAGTSALKTDFTRTGQRTYLGMVNDGVNSMTRYVMNNFFDANRQDAIDEFLGNQRENRSGYGLAMLQKFGEVTQFSTILIVLTFIVLYVYLRY